MGKPILYMTPISPPVKTVLMVCKWIGLEFDTRVMDLVKGDHLTPEFLKLNPTHTLPCLDDNGFVVWDSHAICIYLIDKYAPNDQLYPQDIETRAIINQYLYFDAAALFRCARNAIFGVFFHGNTGFNDFQMNGLRESLTTLNGLLDDRKYLTGDDLTLADLACVPTVTQMEAVITVTEDNYPNIFAWKERMNNELSYYDEINVKPFIIFKGYMEATLEANRESAGEK